MSSLLKDIYHEAFFTELAEQLGDVMPGFKQQAFIQAIFDEHWKGKELKERIRHSSTVMHRFLPASFPEAAGIICKTIQACRKKGVTGGFAHIIFPDYVEQYGLEHFPEAVKAMEFITQFITCEFAVRPYLLRYEKAMYAQMLKWSTHPNEQVRRLSTEGIRPRLPWGKGVPSLKKDPAPIWPVLENLKQDPSETVRRSVANNLNDIAKDHPELVLKRIKQWKGLSPETDALIKHGCRTLLKQGHPEILKFYGLHKSAHFTISGFRVETPVVRQGDALQFSFRLTNTDRKPQTARIEYAMYYLRKNGQLSKKVFKISERKLAGGEVLQLTRKQSFRPITTRVYYPGQQQVALIINGQEQTARSFDLI